MGLVRFFAQGSYGDYQKGTTWEGLGKPLDPDFSGKCSFAAQTAELGILKTRAIQDPIADRGLWVQAVGLEVEGLGFLGLKVSGVRFWVLGLGYWGTVCWNAK